MKMKKKLALFLSLVLVLSLLISACGSSETTTSPSPSGSSDDPSSLSGTINVYTALEDDIINAYLVSFKAKYPNITVNITRDATGTIISKIIAEKDNPVADVIWGTAITSCLPLDDLGLIEPYTPVGAERVLAQFKDKQEPLRWTGMEIPEGAMVVDKVKLAELGLEVPKSFADLLKPEYKGLIQAPDPTISGTGLLILAGVLQMKGSIEDWTYLDALNENIESYPQSGSKPAKNVDAGEIVIGLSMGYRCVTLARENPNLEVVFFEEGCPWDVEANLLIKKDNIKDIAKVFLDWAISDEAMEAYRVEYPIVAIGGDGTVPEGYNQDPVKNLSDAIDLYEIAAYRDTFFEQFTAKYLATR